MTGFIEVDEGTGKISVRGRVIRMRVGLPQIQCIKEAIMSSSKLESETITFNLSEITKKLAESRKKPADKPINLQEIELISVSNERLPTTQPRSQTAGVEFESSLPFIPRLEIIPPPSSFSKSTKPTPNPSKRLVQIPVFDFAKIFGEGHIPDYLD